MKLSKTYKKNKIDKPTLVESVKELAVMSLLVGAAYFLTGVQDLDFNEITAIIIVIAKTLLKLVTEYKKGR